MLVLPTKIRSNGVWYSIDDAETLAEARNAGFNARPLDAEPTFLDEFSAGWVTDLAVAFGGGVGVLAVQALGSLLWARAHGALARERANGEAADVPVRLTIVVSRDPDGSEMRAVSVEGVTVDVVDALGAAFEVLEKPIVNSLGSGVEPRPANRADVDDSSDDDD